VPKGNFWIVGYSFIQTIHVTINQISTTSHPDDYTIVSMTPIFIKPTFLDVWLCNFKQLAHDINRSSDHDRHSQESNAKEVKAAAITSLI
jgi:hypothetical protein